MNRRFKISTTIREDEPIIVTGRVCPAEPDVGIMREYIDDLGVFPESGELSPPLSEAEETDLTDRIWSLIEEN